MSSLAKVNLITELGVLSLKRYIQRKPDNYSEAAQKYATQLGELYRLSLKEKRQVLAARRRTIETELFRLSDSQGQLNGITIDRNCLPGAELNDQILLISQEENDENDGQPFARGVVVKITEQQIRIKFQEPIFKSEPIEEEKKRTPVGDSAREEAAEDPVEATKQDEPSGSVGRKEEVESATTTQHQSVDFRIKFDAHQANEAPIHDEHGVRAVEAALSSFVRQKCHPAIQRSLLGFYDERADRLSEKARVLTFAELELALNNQQRWAIEHALKRRLTLVEGPAGTGKTTVAVHIAANVARQRCARVLVCSPLQTTVDAITGLLDRVGGIQVIRLPSGVPDSSRPHRDQAGAVRCNGAPLGRRRDSYLNSPATESSRCHLDKLVDEEIYLQAYARFRDGPGDSHDKLHAHAYRMVTNCPEVRRRELETKLISKASVVCARLEQASCALLRNTEFDMLILDDVHATSELDCLIAIMARGVKQVVLLSDTRNEIRLSRVSKRSQSVCTSNPTSSHVSNSRNQQMLHYSHATNSLRRKRSESSTTRRRRQQHQRQASTASDSLGANHRAGSSRALSPTKPTSEPGNLFERLLSLGLPSVDLRTQYRCHATLSNFFIHHFYAGRLKDDPDTNDRMCEEIIARIMADEASFSWLPNRKYLTAIYKVPIGDDSEKPALVGAPSRAAEDKLDALVGGLLAHEGVQSEGYTIGIIDNQHTHPEAKTGGWQKSDLVRRGTVDRFIGQECDFVVLVASEARPHKSLALDRSELAISSRVPCDFKRSDTALSWALTRARLGLFIVVEGRNESAGDENQEMVRQIRLHDGDCRSWRELIKYYAANELIVE